MNLRSSEHEASFMVILKRTSATGALFGACCVLSLIREKTMGTAWGHL
jgi:hypothetical protein